jgi:hypothetical protein
MLPVHQHDLWAARQASMTNAPHCFPAARFDVPVANAKPYLWKLSACKVSTTTFSSGGTHRGKHIDAYGNILI